MAIAIHLDQLRALDSVHCSAVACWQTHGGVDGRVATQKQKTQIVAASPTTPDQAMLLAGIRVLAFLPRLATRHGAGPAPRASGRPLEFPVQTHAETELLVPATIPSHVRMQPCACLCLDAAAELFMLTPEPNKDGHELESECWASCQCRPIEPFVPHSRYVDHLQLSQELASPSVFFLFYSPCPMS